MFPCLLDSANDKNNSLFYIRAKLHDGAFKPYDVHKVPVKTRHTSLHFKFNAYQNEHKSEHCATILTTILVLLFAYLVDCTKDMVEKISENDDQ